MKTKNLKSQNSSSTLKRPDKHKMARTDFYVKNPAWSFRLFDKDHERWGLNVQSAERLKGMLSHMRDKEGQTWQEIRQSLGARNTQSHFIDISEILPEAQDRLKALNLTSEVIGDELFSLRLTGKIRLFGVIDDTTGTFAIIWYDAEHEICPSEKKHT